MLEVTFWVAIGCLSGWIGYLASRDGHTHLKAFIIVGILASAIGGVLSRAMGFVDVTYMVDTDSIFSAIIVSAIAVSVFAVILNITEQHTSSNLKKRY